MGIIETALAVAREIGNRRLEGNMLCNLGLLHQVQGRYAEALDQLEGSLAVARDIGDAHMECVVLCNLGMAHDSLARFDEASDYFDAALAIARERGAREPVSVHGAWRGATARLAWSQSPYPGRGSAQNAERRSA